MRRAGRVLFHGALLGLLAGGTVYGLVMVVGYIIMIVGRAFGQVAVPELTVARVVFGVLMTFLWGGLIQAGLTALLRQCRRSHQLSRWIDRAASTPSPALAAAAERAGSEHQVVEIGADAPYAFTYGVWHPRVAVSSGLVARVSQDELVAVLRHEDYHVRHRDPLKVLALRTWAAAFFLIPLIGDVLQRILDRQELKADRAAVRQCGVSPVAAALLKATGEPDSAPGTAQAAMGGPALLEARVIQLETGRGPRMLTAVRRETVLRSLPGIAMVAVYGVLLYQLCLAITVCCVS
ncbi:Zn-dependent protease with chaperone function [Amycolatopsis marina]|uniref:Zn-dependent protease with chaperone function n=1 Tax=Amycolatopsis marina TaxID=490629 RepID=A0A1I1CQ88_9PSEU|nr:M56 family metallopeptidase [Amycolatopsis marina]SFB62760.1 Zn-dependent protease with chaperone function [Amycolatopsis marina]